MTTVNQARFKIDGTPSEDPTTGDPGYVAALGQTLDCTLEISPSSALSVTYSIFDPNDESSPLASYGAPSLTWVGSGLSSETLASPNGTAQIIMPGANVASFIIRCTAVMPEGAHTYERLVAIRATTVPAIRKTVPAEVGEFYARGWSDEQNKMVDAIAAAVSPVGIDSFGSAGTYQATWVVDAGGGAVNVSAGTGWLRTTASVTGTLVAATWLASAGIVIPADSTRYIGVEYNGGAPQVVSRVANSFNGLNDFLLATVYNEAGTLHILEHEQSSQDGLQSCYSRLFNNFPLSRGERAGGLIVGDTGVRNLTMSAGLLFDGLSRFTISAIDTSGASRFDYYYRDGGVGWTKVVSQSQYSNSQYDDGTGVLHALTAGRYGITWWYLESDGHVVGIYGQGDYTSLAAAEDATPPATVPGRITSHGMLIGRTIVLQGAAAATEVESVFSIEFGTTAVTSHNSLGGLQGGGAGEYYHLTAAQATDLTDGGTCSSHVHTLDQSYGAAAATVTIDAYDVLFNLTGAYSVVVDLTSATSNKDGFIVQNGTDAFQLLRTAVDTIVLDFNGGSMAMASSAGITLDATTNDSRFSVAGGNLTLSTTTSGTLALSSAALLTLSDGYKSGSTYATDLVLSDSIAEWSAFDTAFTEVSLLNAITGLKNGNAATVTVADTADTTCFVGLFEDATGSLAAKTDAALTYNASTGALSATSMGVATGGAYLYNAVAALRGVTATNDWFVGNAGNLTVSGTTNLGFGPAALANVSTSTYNLALGRNALTTGTTGLTGMVAVGSDTFYSVATGSYSLAFGDLAGKFITGGSTPLTSVTNCIYIGSGARAFADTMTNEIVIGQGATGAGSNTATLGNTSIVKTQLRGNFGTLVTYGTSAAGVLGLASGTAPTTSPADAVQMWSADLDGVGGYASLYLRTEDNYRLAFGSAIGGVRHETADTAGLAQTFRAGGATSGATNKAGGNLLLYPGVSTGSGTSYTLLYGYPGIAAATTDNTAVDALRVTASGVYVGPTTADPTAYLHLKAGTATAGTAPIKMTAGVNTTVAVSGQIEYDGTSFYGTDSTPTRRPFATGGDGGQAWFYAQNTDVDTGTETVDSFTVDNTDGLHNAGSCFWHFFCTDSSATTVVAAGYCHATWSASAETIAVTYTVGAAGDVAFTLLATEAASIYTIALQATVGEDNWRVQVQRAPYLIGHYQAA